MRSDGMDLSLKMKSRPAAANYLARAKISSRLRDLHEPATSSSSPISPEQEARAEQANLGRRQPQPKPERDFQCN